MTDPDTSWRQRWLPPILAVLFLAVVTEIPYAHGRGSAPAGHHHDGTIAYSEDIHAYLSFARQSAEGSILFENHYAAEPQRAIFFNLEWLIVGKALRGLGDPAALTAWRLSGVVFLVFGFWTLSGLLPGDRSRLIALVLFCLGGGFGWLGAVAKALVPAVAGDPLGFLEMDQGTFGLHPFVQMLQNPHFALPHGLVLFALAFLVAGEKTGRTSAYALAGVMALLAGLSRPYELLAFAVVVPALHLASGHLRDFRRLGQRALVLLILAPAWLPVVVLLTEPSFRPMAQQGRMSVVAIAAHLLGLGVCLVLLAVRLVGDRGFLRAPENRVLLFWSATIFLLVHANRFTAALTYSPQLMITSMGPLVLLAVPVIATVDLAGRLHRTWLPLAVLALALPSSALVLAKRFREATEPHFLFSEGEQQAWRWLAGKARPSDLVLATAESGNRLPRYVSTHVFTGQWALTPDYRSRTAQAEAFFRGRLSPAEAEAFLQIWGVEWIWVGPRERGLGGWAELGFAPGCVEAYDLGGVRILRCDGGARFADE